VIVELDEARKDGALGVEHARVGEFGWSWGGGIGDAGDDISEPMGHR